MAELDNFNVTSPQNQNLLIYSNGEWVNTTISSFYGLLDGRYSVNTHNHDGTYMPVGSSYLKSETYPAASLYTKAEIDNLIGEGGGGGGPAIDTGITYLVEFDGSNFGNKLQAAINATEKNGVIDCRSAPSDIIGGSEKEYIQDNTIIINKPMTIYLPAGTITFNNPSNANVHQFRYSADNISMIGTGRSANDELKLETTTLRMTNSYGGYHIYARGQNVIKLAGMDLIGIRTTSFEAQAGSSSDPIDGTGGIYLEKQNPGTLEGGNNVNQINLVDLYIEATRAHGIYIDTPILAVLGNVRISQAGGHGVFLNGGTSSRFDNVYVSSAHKAGFCLYRHSYGALIACAAEYSGIGYWMRSSNAISLISTGAESNGNRSQNVPDMGITTTNAAGQTVVIDDVGGDNQTNFWRGHGYAITGGRNISLQNVYATNSGLPGVNLQSTQTRSILVKGNARGVEIRNPRITMSSGNSYSGRFDIALEALGSLTPRGTEIIFNPYEDAIRSPNQFGEVITRTDNSDYSCPILDEGENTMVRYGSTVLSFLKNSSLVEVTEDTLSVDSFDAGKHFMLKNPSGCTITVDEAYDGAGSEIYFTQDTDGECTFVEDTGITITSPLSNHPYTRHSTVMLTSISSNEWLLSGDLG